MLRMQEIAFHGFKFQTFSLWIKHKLLSIITLPVIQQFLMSVFHFCSIVPKRSVILCFLSGSVELMTSTRKKILWYVTIRLKWKTGLKANFHSGKLSVDWNGQENFSLSCELWVGTNDFNTKKNCLVHSNLRIIFLSGN